MCRLCVYVSVCITPFFLSLSLCLYLSLCLSLSVSLTHSLSLSLSPPPPYTYTLRYDCSDVERLSAEQNCEVVIAADEYYKKCVSEPPGSQASWNARDQHMTTTLLRIQAHLGDPKVRVTRRVCLLICS